MTNRIIFALALFSVLLSFPVAASRVSVVPLDPAGKGHADFPCCSPKSSSRKTQDSEILFASSQPSSGSAPREHLQLVNPCCPGVVWLPFPPLLSALLLLQWGTGVTEWFLWQFSKMCPGISAQSSCCAAGPCSAIGAAPALGWMCPCRSCVRW